jgi:hypothetical protein
MASIEQFVTRRGWSIMSWQVDRPGQIPARGFTVDGSLVIGIVQGPTPSCSLVWLDQDGQPSFMRDLSFQEGRLHAADFPVSFGGTFVRCDVDLTIGSGVLTGKLVKPGGVDGNTGTFAADANPGG